MTAEKPGVSFIIPAFNEAGALPACLHSILTLKGIGVSFEVIVVDNNSTDQTAKVAEASGVRVVPCIAQGIAAARNAGALEAKGDLLAFIDADGRVSQGWLNAALLGAEKSGVVTGWNYFRERNVFFRLYFNSYSIVFFALQSLSRFFGKTIVAGNNLVIRRDLFDRAGGFPCYVGEDVKLARILSSQKVIPSFSLGMIVSYSSRRFRKRGFLRTLALWITSLFSDISEQDYRLDYGNL
jgi:glycosyltransferase involved in cell wall biosynthesis